MALKAHPEAPLFTSGARDLTGKQHFRLPPALKAAGFQPHSNVSPTAAPQLAEKMRVSPQESRSQKPSFVILSEAKEPGISGLHHKSILVAKTDCGLVRAFFLHHAARLIQ